MMQGHRHPRLPQIEPAHKQVLPCMHELLCILALARGRAAVETRAACAAMQAQAAGMVMSLAVRGIYLPHSSWQYELF